MKNKIKAWIMITCFLLVLIIPGCSKKKQVGDIKVYYLNLDGSAIVQETYHSGSELPKDGNKQVDVYMKALADNPDSDNAMRAIPEKITVLDYNLKNYFLTINFSKEYQNLNKQEEVLTRAAIVKTLTQIENVVYVTFLVEGQPLLDKRENAIGPMSAETFSESADATISNNLYADLKLYFADSTGSFLVSETQRVYYSSNDSLEKLVMKKLIAGPKTKSLVATVPASTHLITISLMDGVCYVNVDANFLDQNQEVSESIVLYSIVNSLTELPVVKKVQLSINGDTSGKIRYIYNLSELYERDESFIKNDKAEDTGK